MFRDWWIKQEQKFGEHEGATFRKDRPNYIKLVEISKTQQDLFGDDDQMTCFCHD